AAAGREPDFNRLVRAWGGVTIVYRKRLQDSPAYRLNHEEVIKSLEEGIRFAERLNPVECIADEYGAIEALRCEYQVLDNDRWKSSGEFVTIPARAVMVAAGTHPNTTYDREHRGSFKLDDRGEFYLGHKLQIDNGVTKLVPVRKGETGFFTSYERNGR